MSLINIGSEPCCEKSVSSPSILDNLQWQKKSLEERLARVNAALDALQQNPEVAKVLELVAKANY